MNYNRVILAGNLTRDPKLSFTPAQVPVCDFGMAVNKKWKGADGQQREETCFVDCRAFKRTAEVINEHFAKGKPIFIEGALHFSSWEKEGKKHSKIRVTVRSFVFIGAPQEQRSSQTPAQSYAQQPPAVPQAVMDSGQDIPF